MPKDGASNDEHSKALDDIAQILGSSGGYTEHLAMGYMLNLMKNTDSSSPLAYKICYQAEVIFRLAMLEQGLDFPVERDKSDAKTHYKYIDQPPHNAVNADDWKTLQEYFQQRFDATATTSFSSPAYKNLMLLADHLDMAGVQKELLELVYVITIHPEMKRFFSEFVGQVSDKMAPAFALMLDKPESVREISSLIAPHSSLMSNGLLEVSYSPSGRASFMEIEPALLDKLSGAELDEGNIVKTILGKPVSTELTLDDFLYLGDSLQLIKNLIENAADRGEKGVNILLHGPAGGGKTELAKVLAKELGYALFTVGEDGHDDDSQKRRSDLLRAQALLKGNKDVFLFFDEMEDLLKKGTDSQKAADPDNKVLLNRLLEENNIVTIWAANDPEKFQEAVRQRFSLALYIGYPPTMIRKNIWEAQLNLKGVSLEDDRILALARKYEAPPRAIEQAVRAMAITGGGVHTIEESLASSAKITEGHRNGLLARSRVPDEFDADLVTVEGDADNIVSSFVKRKEAGKRFSVFAEGPEGAGSTAFLRYLAEKMIMNVSEYSMIDLATPSAMMTPEQKVRAVFSKAADAGSFLIINDIERLVPAPYDSGNEKQWRKSELARIFLDCARDHAVPFAVTTNDQNAQIPERFRHLFSDSLIFGPLSDEQACEAYSCYFGEEDAPEELHTIKDLLLSDFSAVRDMLDNGSDDSMNNADDIIRLLWTEKNLRQNDGQKNEGRHKPPLGFQRPAPDNS